MQARPEGHAPSTRRPVRRLLAALLALVGALEIVYVVGGLALVRSGQVGRWINTDPAKLRITFDSVWPIVPGVVRVRGFRIVNQGRPDQLEGTVEEVWGAVNPLEIPAGRIHIVWLWAHGVAFRLRPRPATAAEAEAGLPAGFAPIEGVPWAAYAGPPAAAKGKKDGATIVFTRASLEGVREVWISERRLRGDGAVLASVTIHGDGRIAIPLADVRFERASVENGTEETYSGVTFRVRGELPPFDPDDPRGVPVLTELRARVDLDTRMPSGAAFLNVYFRNAPWIRFAGGESALAVHLSVDRGQLAPGGSVELLAQDLQADFAGFTARGRAKTRLDVVAREGEKEKGAEARVLVEFEKYGLRRGNAKGEPFLLGRGLRVQATTPASLAAIPPSDFSGRLDLGKAEFPRLDFLNELLPVGGDLKVRGGSAKVEGSFDVTKSGAACRGSMKVRADGLSVESGGVAMKGAFSLALMVPRGNLLKPALDVDGTLLALDRFSFETRHENGAAQDWSASVAFPSAHLELGEPFAVRGSLEHRASDSRPIVAFLSADEPLSGWKKKLLTVGEIKGGGRFALAGQTLEVADYSVGWSSVRIQARFRKTPKGTFGKAHVKDGILEAGIGFEGEKRKLHVLRPEHWYNEP